MACASTIGRWAMCRAARFTPAACQRGARRYPSFLRTRLSPSASATRETWHRMRLAPWAWGLSSWYLCSVGVAWDLSLRRSTASQVCVHTEFCCLKMENSLSMTSFWRCLCIKCISFISQNPLGCWLRFTAVLIYSMYPALFWHQCSHLEMKLLPLGVLSPELI